MQVHTINRLIGLFLIAICSSNLSAQSIKSCGHDHAQGGAFESPEAFEKAKAEVIKGAFPKFLRNSGQKNNTAITVPVVFHIIHAGEAEGVGSNLPDGRVQAQLDVLNEDFSASNPSYSDITRPEWDAVKGNPLITFCKASVDPDGNPTTGIVRHDIAITGMDANNNNIEDVKAGIFWDSDKYMNVYVLSIPGTDEFGGVVGYAFLPYFGTVGTSADGIVVDYNWFGGEGYSQSGAKTLTHEVGHYLGLFHTFNGSSCGNDDGSNDTPNINDATASVNPTLSCGNAMNPYPTGPSSCGNEHMYINYMDYVNDENCPTSFSLDQVAIMRGVLEGTASGFTTRAPLVTNANTACTGNSSCDLAATTTHSNTTCNDSNDGTVTVVASDGILPYIYEWSTTPVQTSATVTGLVPGTYFVTTTDDEGCTVVNSAVIQAPAAIEANMSSTDETISGESDGLVSASPTGGTAPYTYQWDNNLGNSSNYAGLAPGTYSVTITDNNNCTVTGSTVVDAGSCGTLIMSASTTNVACFGGSDGSANITVTNGTAPYTYTWNGQAFDDERLDLSAGSYTVIVTDSLGCTGDIIVVISEPIVLSSSLSTTGVSGIGMNDGTATVSASGGTAPYTYAWSNGGGNTPMIGNLSPGTYTVTITDDNNCSMIASDMVLDFNCTSFDVSLSGGELLCAGDVSFMTVSNVSSTGPFTYVWNTGETTDAIAISSGGTYTVSIQDANGCMSSESKVIADAPSGLSISFSSFAESAPDTDDGRIETQIDGGSPGYTYLWSNGATSGNLDNLAPGTYSFTVSDANNCSETATAEIREFTCSPFSITLSTQDASCHNRADGHIDANPIGAAPFIYNWSNGATTKSIDLLVAGTYMVTVTDNNGCTSTASGTINEPTSIDIQYSKSNESVLDANDGEISITVSGGSSGYTYLWSDGSAIANRTGLSPGQYSLTVSDSNNCSNNIVVTIFEYSCGNISIEPAISDVGCAGGASGSIVLNIQEIAAPYTVLWSTGSTDETVSGLSSGIYSATLTDVGGCELLRTFTLTEPSPLLGNTSSTAETANDANDGTATIMGIGGTAPFTYAWSSGETTADLSALAPGGYIVTVSDNNACVYVDTVSVGAYLCPPFDIAALNSTDNLCSGDDSGVLGASISGGTAPYDFQWSNGGTTASIEGLIAGTYSVIVTDSKNCQVTETASILDPVQLQVIPTMNHVSAVGTTDGNISLAIQGGVAPYTTLWDNGSTTKDIENLSEGTYGYTVTDDNGCIASGIVVIEQYVCPDLAMAFDTANITCNGDADGELTSIPTNGTAPYSYLWSTGSTDEQIFNLSVGNYTVTATDSRGCNVQGTATISEPDVLAYTMQVTDESRGNANDGTITLDISGGTAPYEVTWADAADGAIRIDLTPGAYAFVIVDANRCSASGEVDVIAYDCPEIEIAISVFNNECSDGDIGGVDVVTTNGTAPFTYEVNGELYESASIRGLSAGSYEVVAIDDNGCQASALFEVETPMGMTINELTTDDTSGMLPGAAGVSVVGGTEPYSYLWTDGRTNAANNALFPGIHHVIITDSLGCELVQEVIIRQTEDIGIIEDLQLFESHPNPASDMVNVQMEFSVAKDIRVIITNLSGQPVFDEVLNTQVYDRDIDISGFPKGMYSINVYSAEDVTTKPLAIF